MTLKEASDILSDAGIDDSLHEARAIFRHFGKFSDIQLLSRDTQTDCDAVISAISRRATREPLQYIIGEVDFYRESYIVSEDCLIPRSDTEILVDYAVKHIPRGASFIDLCTGSGCIAVSVLKNTEDTAATALDISDAALAIAKKNAERHGVSDRLTFLCKDVMSEAVGDKVFAVLSNPPYVTDEAYLGLSPEIYFEPKTAFVGGIDGGDFYRAITPLYKDRISKDGFIAYEIGYDQKELIEEISKDNGMSAEIIKDFSGNVRVAVLRLK